MTEIYLHCRCAHYLQTLILLLGCLAQMAGLFHLALHRAPRLAPFVQQPAARPFVLAPHARQRGSCRLELPRKLLLPHLQLTVCFQIIRTLETMHD